MTAAPVRHLSTLLPTHQPPSLPNVVTEPPKHQPPLLPHQPTQNATMLSSSLGIEERGWLKYFFSLPAPFHLHKLFYLVILLCYGELLGGIPTQPPFTLAAVVLWKGIPPLLSLPSLLPILLPLLSPLIRSTTLTRRNAILLHPQSFLA
ncbi:unnamed protein product [Linum trigynum]|uniref:Uncharacterized protein n=1 Tax=Linum trigynum TaxID=586398 RepID=A0AAV2F6V3_9ROSI